MKLLQDRRAYFSVSNKLHQLPIDLSQNPEIRWLLEGRDTSVSHPYELYFVALPPSRLVAPQSALAFGMCPGRKEGTGGGPWKLTYELSKRRR